MMKLNTRSDLEFRMADSSDDAAVRRLWSYAFNGDEPFASWYFNNYYNPDNALCCWRGQHLLAVLHLHPYQIYVRGAVVPVSYIVGVATDPTARRGGLTGTLLNRALAWMRECNRPLSILMPFKAGFYYPYDWQLCYHHLKYRLLLEDLRPLARPSGELVPVGLSDWEQLADVYTSFVKDKHGYVVRQQTEWRHLLSELKNDQGHAYLLTFNERPVGYIFYTLQAGQIIVRELAYCDQAAQLALIDFLYSHRSHAQTVDWNAPLDLADPVLFGLFEAKQDLRVFPFMTARFADVEQGLALLTYPSGSWQITMTVSDELAAWNNNTFELSVDQGQARLKPAAAPGVGVQLTVGTLTQLVLGRLSAAQLLAQGKIQATPTEIAVLTALFPPCNNFINEYF